MRHGKGTVYAMELEQLKTFFIQLWNVISTFWNSGFLKLCSNVLDIVLVAFIVYHAIKLIREITQRNFAFRVAICCCQSIQNGSDDVCPAQGV